MTDTPPLLLRHFEAGIATLTLNRPESRNALSAALMTELTGALDAIARDASVKVVVLAANGPAFCAGHDVREMSALRGQPNIADFFGLCSRMMLGIKRQPQPVIAKVHGMAAAAGCQLATACDLAYASTAARFATSGINLGLFCTTPGVPLARSIGPKAAMEMLLTGLPIDGDTAQALGLVNRSVASEHLDAEVMRMATEIASKSAHVIKLGKQAFHRQIEMELEQAYGYAAQVMTANMLTKDVGEGFDAFVNKRKPEWLNC